MKTHKMVDKDGITAAILSDGKVLLLKRRPFPLLVHSGLWSFVSGARKRNENHMFTAFREIEEETGLKMHDLTQLGKEMQVTIFDDRKGIQWTNHFYVFHSKTENVKLNLENSKYRWVSIENLAAHTDITLDYFKEKDEVFRLIQSLSVGHVAGKRR